MRWWIWLVFGVCFNPLTKGKKWLECLVNLVRRMDAKQRLFSIHELGDRIDFILGKALPKIIHSSIYRYRLHKMTTDMFTSCLFNRCKNLLATHVFEQLEYRVNLGKGPEIAYKKGILGDFIEVNTGHLHRNERDEKRLECLVILVKDIGYPYFISFRGDIVEIYRRKTRSLKDLTGSVNGFNGLGG